MSLQLYSERQEALLYLQLIFKLGKVVIMAKCTVKQGFLLKT
jgi:hypothetical protein